MDMDDLDDVEDVDRDASDRLTLLQIRVSRLEEQQLTTAFHRAAEELGRPVQDRGHTAQPLPRTSWSGSRIQGGPQSGG
jgi:hypothetical protein